MAIPTYLNEGGGDKVLNLVDAAEAARYLAAIEISSAPSGYGWMGVGTHVEGDAVASPGGFTVTAAPLVLIGGDDGTNVRPLQVDASLFLKVILQAGTAAIGKLAANSGVDIGDVDVLSLPSLPAGSNAIGKLAANSGVDIGDVDVLSLPTGQGVMAGSTPVVLASDHSDIKITLDGEAIVLGAGSAAIGKLAANSGVDIGDVDVLSIPATAAEAAALPAVFMVVAGDDGTDTQPLQLAADGDLKVTLDGETPTVVSQDNGPQFTVLPEQLTKSTTAAETLHTTTGGTRFFITDIIISISGTAVDVTLAFGVGTAMTTTALVFYGDVRGGLTHPYRAPLNRGAVADNLNITLSAAVAMSITICGYEV